MQGPNMTALIKELTVDEGMRKKPYKCTAGKTTIGIGRNLDDVGISQEEAEYLLRNDIKKAVEEAKKFPWYEGLSPVRKRVIVNMIFNLGITRFKKFKKTIQYISVGDFQSASTEMLDSGWANQVGPRAKRLSKMMKLGQVPTR
jgi:lysozyme